MKPSETFAIDPHEPWVVAHNEEVRRVRAAFDADEPIRVPVTFDGARSVWADENDIDYRSYYSDPEEMARCQLEWQKRERELPLGDRVLGELPDTWGLNVDFHPVLVASCLSCEILFRRDAVPAHKSRRLSKSECVAMPMPDLHESGLLPRVGAFREHINRHVAGKVEFMGRPIELASSFVEGVDANGTFCHVLDVRGPEVMIDMYEDPQFVHEFLLRMATWQIDLGRVQACLAGTQYWTEQPGGAGLSATDHGVDMLSAATYEEFIVPLIKRLNDTFHKQPNPNLHHCGRGSHLFPVIKKHFGLTNLHALTYPLNDVARVRKDIGYDVWITAIIDDSVLALEDSVIRQMVKDLLTPETKGPGRLAVWVPGEARGFPAAKYLALYEAIKEYGRYE